MVKVVEILSKSKDQSIVYSQYHGSWWPGNVSSQGINNSDIDLIFSDDSSFTNRKV